MVYIYSMKTRENRAKITRSTFGVLHANYGRVTTKPQHAENQCIVFFVLKTGLFHRKGLTNIGCNRTSIILQLMSSYTATAVILYCN